MSESEPEPEPEPPPSEYIHYLPSLPKLISNDTPRSDKSDKTTQSDINERESIVSDEIMKENSMLLNLKDMIYDKKRDLNQSKSILEFKYNKYKWCHNFWNIGTIILSSSLTLIESCKLVFIEDIDKGGEALHNFLILSPIVLGTVITCSASILKFKKYQESMEELYIVIDKCIGMISKLKGKKDEINLIKNTEKQINICHIEKDKCNEDELKKLVTTFKSDVNDITQSFKKDILSEFSSVYQETERYIDHSDYHKYLHTINKIEYKKHILRKDKESFYKTYKENNIHDIELHRIDSIKNKVLKGSDKVENCLGCKRRI
tara:strand:+ start:451 stop:1407 length:957 start_codon:yes stop_codon:yes gene_type:complete